MVLPLSGRFQHLGKRRFLLGFRAGDLRMFLSPALSLKGSNTALAIFHEVLYQGLGLRLRVSRVAAGKFPDLRRARRERARFLEQAGNSGH